MAQPQDERPQLTRRGRPVPAGQSAPGQIQRYRAGVALCRRLGVITPEPHMPKVRIGRRDRPQLVINHRPVPDTRWHPHQERFHAAPAPGPDVTVSYVSSTLSEPVADTPDVALEQQSATTHRAGGKPE